MSHLTPEPETARVVYNTADLRSLYRACRRCKRNALVAILLVPPILLSSSIFGGTRGLDLVYEGAPLVLVMVVAMAVAYWFLPWNAVRQRKRAGWDDPMSISFNDEGIAVEHPTQSSLFYWSKIKDVVVRDHRLFLFTSPACAIIIPSRVLPATAALSDWSRRAEEFWRKANPKGDE